MISTDDPSEYRVIGSSMWLVRGALPVWGIIGVLAYAGCDGNRRLDPPDEDPSVEILAPAEGSTISTKAVDVKIDADSLWLAHHGPAPSLLQRLSLTSVAYAYEYRLGYAALLLDGEQVAEMHHEQFTIDSVGVGAHIIEVVLHYQDGTPVDPPATDTVTFTAE